MDEKLCDERHRDINQRLTKHGEEIEILQKSDVKNSTQIDNLTNAISSQTKAIWGMVLATLSTLLAFFIWYVQTLG